jgi:hypothetical protein
MPTRRQVKGHAQLSGGMNPAQRTRQSSEDGASSSLSCEEVTPPEQPAGTKNGNPKHVRPKVSYACPFATLRPGQLDTCKKGPWLSRRRVSSLPRVSLLTSQLTLHLEEIRIVDGQPVGYDSRHPLNDPRWDEELAKSCFERRKPKVPDHIQTEKKRARYQRFYQNRQAKRTKLEEELEPTLAAGEISLEEYENKMSEAKPLGFWRHIHNASLWKRKFDLATEQLQRAGIGSALVVEGRLNSELTDMHHTQREAPVLDNAEPPEHILQQRRDADLQYSTLGPDENRHEDLENLREELAWKDGRLQKISAQFTRVVEHFRNSEFLESNLPFFDFYSFDWTDDASVQNFYEIAVFLLPRSQWSTTDVRSSAAIRQMKKTLHFADLEQVRTMFKESCERVEEEEFCVESGTAEAQKWIDEQEEMWRDAQINFEHKFSAFEPSRPAIKQMKWCDEISSLYRDIKRSDGEV